MKNLKLIFEQAQKRWAESGHSPDLFWRIQPPLFTPYTTYGAPSDWPWPRTVRESVEQLILRSTIQTKISVLQLKADELGQLHFIFGTWIRNTFGLWQGNLSLYKAIRLWKDDLKFSANDTVEQVEYLYRANFGDEDPSDNSDALSGPIIGAFWGELHIYEWPELHTGWDKVRLAK